MSDRPRRPGSRTLLVVAHDDAETRSRVAAELDRRYACDYAVVAFPRRGAAGELERLAGEPALVLAAPGEDDEGFLAEVRRRFPAARRALLVPWLGWADTVTARAIRTAAARGWIELYVLEPGVRPDEVFHRTVTELLQERARLTGRGPAGAVVRGPPRSQRVHALQETLTALGIPHRHEPGEGPPTVRLSGHEGLVDPSPAELATAVGFPCGPLEGAADVAVVGAGPAGLGAAVYAASEGLSTVVLDRRGIGGQAGSSTLIRNYLGFARGVTGGDLAQRAYQQAWLFDAQFRVLEDVRLVERRPGAVAVHTADGHELSARAAVLALGVDYRRLDVPGAGELAGAGVYYGASPSEAQAFAGEHVAVVGGGNSAGQAALHLARYAERVSVLVRRASLDATMSRYLVDALAAAPNVTVRGGTEVRAVHGRGRLEALELDVAGARETVPAAGVFVLIGGRPRTDWLPPGFVRDARGYLLTGPDAIADGRGSSWPLARPPMPLETSVPGVFAAGDVRARAVKRVAAAVGDGAAAIAQVHEYLAGEAGA